ncbi:HEAT repeat domain-containing protein [Streptomyces sp. CBMA123]|uniref:HEAT repeat domain-containing protein n=1 Tax=Streptomyces sp. CBMA123 TaxID=1896313 RepID=UPI001661C806|nr:HEAT repeat domain-containing protein [Streptomyces sp. CBMA123]MBD0694058.1 hypothetical protein [Streptomyces sp. CBMA123]
MPDPLRGLDEIDWAALRHAYGSAADVPALLHDLTAADSGTRACALDALHGGVHHQGDIHDSTLACLPFLCAIAADPAVEDRGGVLGLIWSIGESAEAAVEQSDEEMPDPLAVVAQAKAADDWWEEVGHAYGILAQRALAELLPPLTALLTDPDPDVRATATHLLASRHPQPAALLQVLLGRVDAERDGAVRHALAGALGTLAARSAGTDAAVTGTDTPPDGTDAAPTGTDAAPDGRIGRALLVLAEPGADPGTELTALAALARQLPELLPADTAERALSALDRAHHRPTTPAPAPQPAATPSTLLSHLRDLRAESFAEGADERTADALDLLHASLGDRVEIRHELVLHGLRHGEPNGPYAAVERAATLHTGWRTSPERAAATAELLGALLDDPDERLAALAVRTLRQARLPCGPELLDAIAGRCADGRYTTGWGWERNLPGECIQLLARRGDGRAAEALAPLLPGRAVPEDLPLLCERLRSRAHSAQLMLALISRARATVELVDSIEETGRVHHEGLRELGRLMGAMAATGRPEANEMLAALLTALLEQAREHGDGALHPDLRVALDRPDGLGPEPGAAVPVLRELLADPEERTRLLAARALFHGGHDPAELLPVLAKGLADEVPWWHRHDALGLLAEMGPAAAPLGGQVRAALDRAVQASDPDPLLLRLLLAARAATPVTPADDRLLVELWNRERATRPLIAEALIREGGRVPEGFAALLRAELVHPRRHGHDGGEQTSVSFRFDVEPDDTLLAHCRELLGR